MFIEEDIETGIRSVLFDFLTEPQFPFMVKLYFLQVCILYRNLAFQFASVSIFISDKVCPFTKSEMKCHTYFNVNIYKVSVAVDSLQIIQRSNEDQMYTEIDIVYYITVYFNNIVFFAESILMHVFPYCLPTSKCLSTAFLIEISTCTYRWLSSTETQWILA